VLGVAKGAHAKAGNVDVAALDLSQFIIFDVPARRDVFDMWKKCKSPLCCHHEARVGQSALRETLMGA
jgi:hypothetical protein